MKICLASLHPRRLSGQIESVLALAHELERLGQSVQLVTAFDQEALDNPGTASPRRETGASAGGKLACLARGIVRLVRTSREADVIHLNLPTPAFSLLADLLVQWTGGAPPVVVGYEAHLVDVRQLLRDDDVRRDLRFYLPLLLVNNGLWGRCAPYRCDRYVVASRWQRAELRALGVPEARLITLPNLVDSDKLHREPRELARRQLLGQQVESPLLGWAGHFHHVKGVDILLQAFGQLSSEYPTARLVLAWTGIGDSRAIRSQIRKLGLGDRIIPLGRVDIGRLCSAVDVMVLPYRLTIGQGAFPDLVLEAMSVGVPLVTSDLPLLRELVEDGRTALLTRPRDPAAVASAVARLVQEPALGASMVEMQQALMSQSLSPSALAARYLDLYHEVLAEQDCDS
jgi:glycosyltransferase involved in cell wall biosynthesis